MSGKSENKQKRICVTGDRKHIHLQKVVGGGERECNGALFILGTSFSSRLCIVLCMCGCKEGGGGCML